MARMSNILEISELKWTGMGEFSSEDHYIYYCGQESLWKSSPHSQQKSPKYSTYVQYQKRQNDISLLPVWTIQHHSNPSLCPKHQWQRRWSWNILWRPTRSYRTNTKKRCPLHYRILECKSRKSWDTWSNRQVLSWSTKWSKQRLSDLCQEDTLVIANALFQQHKRWLYTWTSPDSQHQNQNDYILADENGEVLYSQQKQDWELPVAQMMNSILQNSFLNWRK